MAMGCFLCGIGFMYVNVIVLCYVSLACLLVAQSFMSYGTGACICLVLCRKKGLSLPEWSIMAPFLRKWFIIDTQFDFCPLRETSVNYG